MKSNDDGRIKSLVQHYNHKKYWKMRSKVVNPSSKTPKLIKLFYLYRIKKMDAFNLASFGTTINCGASFDEAPVLPHGLNGIVIGYYCHIGKNCTILQQVTISAGREDQFVSIGDNCLIGAGAKILGPLTIGDNVKIGANAVVVHDVPSNVTVVGVPAKIIKQHDIEKKAG